MPTEKKYSAIIWARNASGASLVVTDNPIGESISSEMANTAMMKNTASAGVVLPTSPAKIRNSRNAAPMPITPMANFIGVDGARSRSLVQMTANTGLSRMIQIGSSDPIHDGGAVHQKMFQSIRSSE